MTSETEEQIFNSVKNIFDAVTELAKVTITELNKAEQRENELKLLSTECTCEACVLLRGINNG